MRLTKHTHATVTLENDGATLVIDPGSYTPDAAELIAATATVLITHDHPDHIDAEALGAALDARADLRVFGPAAALALLDGHGRAGQVTTVAEGDELALDGFTVMAFGRDHAVIHRDMPAMTNVGYLVDGAVFHPGDAYTVPPEKVDTLLVPTSGPWTKLGEAVDFIRGVQPRRAIQIHDLMLSDTGRASTGQFLGPDGLGGVPFETLDLGASVEL
jgi:L-ascorbate metabolism protein UlaG (beta-lactamase superfamily)